ncbi:general substrate transporter [Calocera cornea HHB12733]|uniref:General substrate transporter n=1 Tax=Calocera cornea HHB12733 TaxID=1353952 RepID=A0A165HD17_9BASI|nr:general substrate transporter [Calocera cornea HHB12733]
MSNSPLADALLKEPPNPWAPHMFKLYAVLFVCYLCATTNGFDANTFGGLLATPTFTSYFGLNSNNEGLVTAMYVIGNCVGSVFAAECADRWGRKFGMTLGSAICIVAVIIQVSSNSRGALMAGRFILGVGAVIVQTSGPAYAAEMSHPAYRGVLTGLYETCFFLGTILTTWTEYGLSYMTNPSSFQWRFPLSLQALPSIVILIFIWKLPETPRWYMSQGREDTAKAILVKYHAGGNEDSLIVKVELDEMRELISVDGADKRWWDWSCLFNTPGNRHRFSLVAAIALFGELDLPPTSYYLPLMVATAGITSTKTQLLLNALQTPIMMISALSGLRWIDYFGRRPLLMISSAGMAASVFIITACTAHQAGHPVIGGVGIAFIYVFLVIFAFAWTPCQYLYPSEVLAFANRAKGLAALNLMNNLCKVLNTYVPPIAVKNMNWRFYILYGIWDAIGVVFMWFFFVETRGRNLEEIDAIFDDPHPVKASLRMQLHEVSVGEHSA